MAVTAMMTVVVICRTHGRLGTGDAREM